MTPPEVGAGVTGVASVFHHSAVVRIRPKCSHNSTDVRSRMFLQLWRGGIYIPNGAKFDLPKNFLPGQGSFEQIKMFQRINSRSLIVCQCLYKVNSKI